MAANGKINYCICSFHKSECQNMEFRKMGWKIAKIQQLIQKIKYYFHLKIYIRSIRNIHYILEFLS